MGSGRERGKREGRERKGPAPLTQMRPCLQHVGVIAPHVGVPLLHYEGVGVVLAKLASTAKPTMYISIDDDGVWKIRSETTFKTNEVLFKLGEEFDETTPDGRKVRVRELCFRS